MDARQLKAKQIVATDRITVRPTHYLVPSQSGSDRYRVTVDGLFPSCTCADFETTGRECKHITAVRLLQAEGPTLTPEQAAAPVPRKTYRQDWKNYNLSQTTEKAWFLTLLADLTADIPDPDRATQRGRPIPLADAVFAAVYKVYSGFSARRLASDLEHARDRGHIARAPHFNSVLNVFDNPAVTPILSALIARSASPLRAVETEFAVDSSGFSGSRFDRWFDEKYGADRSAAAWVKAHIICGTRTNVIAAADVLDKDSGDSPQLPRLVEAAAKGFRIHEVAADKAYPSVANFDAVDRVGGTLYAAFKSNATGAVGGLFGKAFHFFGLHREEFLAHYHRRSMVESTFSMVKRKFGDAVRAKTDTAMRNEVLAKFVCHNICCVIAAIYERGVNPVFLGLDGEPDDRPRDILKFPGCTMNVRPAQ